jgi:Na+-driven multidrug efflux pump
MKKLLIILSFILLGTMSVTANAKNKKDQAKCQRTVHGSFHRGTGERRLRAGN